MVLDGILLDRLGDQQGLKMVTGWKRVEFLKTNNSVKRRQEC
jgi:hypothetical protein